MEGLEQLVTESLALNGVVTRVDYRRLNWSEWFRCDSPATVRLLPGKPGIYALAEEVLAPGEAAVAEGKRMLALFQISAATDLPTAMERAFLPGSPVRERMESGRCFARYTVIEDIEQRQTALDALRQWMESSVEVPIAA